MYILICIAMWIGVVWGATTMGIADAWWSIFVVYIVAQIVTFVALLINPYGVKEIKRITGIRHIEEARQCARYVDDVIDYWGKRKEKFRADKLIKAERDALFLVTRISPTVVSFVEYTRYRMRINEVMNEVNEREMLLSEYYWKIEEVLDIFNDRKVKNHDESKKVAELVGDIYLYWHSNGMMN